MLKYVTINSGYYESDSASKNDSKGDSESIPKVATHISSRKRRKVIYNSNVYFNKNY